MPSDNLGVGVFDDALASSADARSSGVPAGLEQTAVSGSRFWHVPLVSSALLATGDMAFAAVAVGLAWLIGCLPEGTLPIALIAGPVLVSLAFLERGLYRRATLASQRFALGAIGQGILHALVIVAVLRLAVGSTGFAQVPQGSAVPLWLTLPVDLFLTFAALLTWRLMWRLAGPASAKPASHRVVVVGDYTSSARLLPQLRRQPGVEIVAVIEPDSVRPARSLDGVRIVSGLRELEVMVRGGIVDTALIAGSAGGIGLTAQAVIDQARISTLNVHALPGLGLAGKAATMSRLGELPVLSLCRRPLSQRALLLKRIEDVVVGGAALLLLLPILLMVAIAVRLDSKGPIFFRQPRVGLNGTVFEMFKFRSMYHHATDAGAVRQTARGDKRVTRVGAILRKHSLDELPQILNVLRGDMSIVGPRPHALSMTAEGMALEEAARDYPARFRMKPGITGWAQTNGWRGNVDSVEKLIRRVEHDIFYIENWSIGLDLLILRKTVSCVVSDETAF